MGFDQHGNLMSGDPATIERFDVAIDRLLRYHPSVIDLAVELGTEDGAVPMGQALFAYLNLFSTDWEDLETAGEVHRGLLASPANDRESAHAAAIGDWLRGDWHGAARRLADLLVHWPTDVLALTIGHALDFFVGDAQTLRDRPLAALRVLDHPHAEFVHGMAAFGLEEAGHYDQALDHGTRAVEANPDDVWGIHAVVHTHEMRGDVDTGIGFLRSDATRWEAANLFAVHIWWHLALYQLETGRPAEALAIYDAQIHHDESAPVALELLDASALLWRCWLEGVDTGPRFSTLADAWTPKVTGGPAWYAFNDVHAAMAFVGAGRLDEARAVIARLTAAAAAAESNGRFTTEVGLPAARALVAFAEDRHDDVIGELLARRRMFAAFGGSHAQRDALQRTLLESALRAGRYDLAATLTAERLGVRESSVYGWTQRARALRGLGDEVAAGRADASAAGYRERFATAS